MSVIHPNLKDGWPLIPQLRDCLGDLVQFVDATSAILIPKEELFIVTQTKGVIQLLTLVHHLLNQEPGEDRTVISYRKLEEPKKRNQPFVRSC